MDQRSTKAALTRFLDTVTQKGLVNANTANGWRAACTRILEDVGDGEDVRSLDLPTAVKRYKNRHPGDLSPSSLKEYERRLGLVLKEFTSYVNDPAAYKGRGRGIGKQNGDRSARTARRGNKAAPVVAELARPEKADNARPIVTPGLSLEFPMRPDFLAQVVIPRDMKVDEAKRLSRFILTLALDFQPNDNGG